MSVDIVLLLKCLATGMIGGAAFSLLKLPVPAPPAIEGVVGILGLLLGWRIVAMLFH